MVPLEPGQIFFSNLNITVDLFLHKDENDPNTYVLIDTWVNKQTYEDFKKQNAQRYNELSKQFEYLYATEEKIGGYNWVK